MRAETKIVKQDDLYIDDLYIKDAIRTPRFLTPRQGAEFVMSELLSTPPIRSCKRVTSTMLNCTHSRGSFMTTITVSKEDYLKAIAKAEAEGETVIAATLAHWLSVSRPAVTFPLSD